MAFVTFTAPIQFNAYSTGTFDPTLLINDPGVTVITNTTAEWRIQKDVAGVGTVQLSLKPGAGNSFTPGQGAALPGGVVDTITVFTVVQGAPVQIAFLSGLGTLGRQASQITSGQVLFSGQDAFVGSTSSDLFHSGPGSDTVNGGGGDDVLIGGGGVDTLNGGNGDDVLVGDGPVGPGNSLGFDDRLNGGPGRDSLYSDGAADAPFADIFIFSSAADTLFGYDAVAGRYNGDVIYNYSGDAIDLTAIDGRIIIAKFGTNTNIYLDTDSDGLGEDGEGQIIVYNAEVLGFTLMVGSRSITYYGAAGADAVTGGAQADILAGYAGGDTIIGNGGGDFIYTGVADGAADTVRFDRVSDSAYSLSDVLGASADKVYEFVSGQDKLDFSPIAGTKSALIQTLGSDSYMYVDIGNNGSYDMTVLVVGATVVQSDLILQSAPAPDDAQSALGADAFESPLLPDSLGRWDFA